MTHTRDSPNRAAAVGSIRARLRQRRITDFGGREGVGGEEGRQRERECPPIFGGCTRFCLPPFSLLLFLMLATRVHVGMPRRICDACLVSNSNSSSSNMELPVLTFPTFAGIPALVDSIEGTRPRG